MACKQSDTIISHLLLVGRECSALRLYSNYTHSYYMEHTFLAVMK